MEPMLLTDLLRKAGLAAEAPSTLKISDLVYDSRLVKQGDLFFALPGVHVDGHAYLEDVFKKGAAAAIVEKKSAMGLPQVVVPNAAQAMSVMSAAFFKDPSREIPVVGITGTNGKTTSTYILETILNARQKKVGVMGTINYRSPGRCVPAPNTTPMAVDVERFLRAAADDKLDAVLMEVSSHALAQGRVEGVRYAVGVFTNLTQDHLDFHLTMESYFKAKARLFNEEHGSPKAILNIDDGYGARLKAEGGAFLTYGFDPSADLCATNPELSLQGLRFDMRFPSGRLFKIESNLLGHHNILNLLGSAGAALGLNLTEEDVVDGLNRKHRVPGRLERVEAGQSFVVTVDYAHTDDALTQVLRTLRDTKPRRLLCVFGAGGDRDKTKRPKMGRAAAQLADEIIVTSDNPRSEDPQQIMAEIETGLLEAGASNYALIEDRGDAIKQALSHAKANDIVLIAGKGHETYQIYKDRTVHFSDSETARAILEGKIG